MVYVSMTGMENFDNWAHGLTFRLLEAIVALKKRSEGRKFTGCKVNMTGLERTMIFSLRTV